MSVDGEERVVVSTFVNLPPKSAFEIFTREIDSWWRKSPRYRRVQGEIGSISFDGAPPERLVERGPSGETVLGRVLGWEAGKRLAFEWYGGDFSKEDRSEVEVRFVAHRAGTQVTLEHKNLSALPLTHRARHGFSGEAFEAMLGYFWADLLTGYRARAAA
jgi:uncharacterized protein YndB with AHSA1/START domain